MRGGRAGTIASLGGTACQKDDQHPRQKGFHLTYVPTLLSLLPLYAADLRRDTRECADWMKRKDTCKHIMAATLVAARQS